MPVVGTREADRFFPLNPKPIFRMHEKYLAIVADRVRLEIGMLDCQCMTAAWLGLQLKLTLGLS